MLLLHFFTMHSWGELFTRFFRSFAFDFYQIRGHFSIISPIRTPPDYQFKYIVGISRFSIDRINMYCSGNIVNIHWQSTLRESWNIDYIVHCLRGHFKNRSFDCSTGKIGSINIFKKLHPRCTNFSNIC